MRFHHPDGTTVHLAYSANVHPAEDLDGTLGRLHHVAGPVRAALDVSRLGIALWLPAPVAAALAAGPAALAGLRGALGRLGLEVVTVNGFPYQGFSEPVVKHAVYQPDWADPRRAAYTIDLATVLARLLPDDVTLGSISTLPLAWRIPWEPARRQAARSALLQVADRLASLEAETGRRIRVALEPEPGCVLESAAQAAAELAGLAPEWVGVCLDACHLAVGFEDPTAALATLRTAGVDVVKAQVSCALKEPEPGTSAGAARLAGFVEPRFLHQTREQTSAGLVAVDDLDEALAGGLPGKGEWRVHFHTPVHAEGRTTQAELAAFLEAMAGAAAPVTPHLELETYTWSVLPPHLRPADDQGLIEGLTRELAWVRDRLERLGLKEAPA